MAALRRAVPAMMAGAAAAALLVWIAGVRLIDPREIGWTMRLDWQWHELGWQMFRYEPWGVPPGRIAREFHPVGTSIAFTDSIPLVALALKPFARLLPEPFQYLGLWLALCYALQGAFGAVLARLVTPRPLLQVLTGMLLATSPVLLDRVGHVALCSQFLILIAFWLYARHWTGAAAARIAAWTFLVTLAAFVHPYLWLMLFVLSAAALVRYAWTDRVYDARAVAIHAAGALLASAAAAWTLGWFMVGGREDLAGTGLGDFSMNLLGPIASSGISSLVPALPVFDAQTYEGLNYLGLGALALSVIAAAMSIRHPPSPHTVRMLLPLVAACGLLALLALSPRITLGRTVLVELPLPAAVASAWSAFRATGRLFWPAGYLVVVGAAMTVIARAPHQAASALLALAIVLQVVDLQGRYLQDRAVRSDPSFYQWTNLADDAAWVRAAATRKHIVVLPTIACGVEPVPYAPLVAFAAPRGLTVNTGYAARVDLDALRDACSREMAAARAGDLRADTLYIAAPPLAAALRAASRTRVDCRPLLGAEHCTVDVDH